MKQFDVFRNPSEASRGFAPFIVALQSHHLILDTVLVAPLANDKRATSIEIGVTVEGQSLVVALTEMGSVRVASLSNAVGDLATYEDDIDAHSIACLPASRSAPPTARTSGT